MTEGKFSHAVLFLFLLIFLVSQKTEPLFASYDSTYVLSIKQKFAIPENVENGDYIGTWIKTWTWKSQGSIRFSIETNYYDAFAVNSHTGLLTINNATRINGKVVKQDTLINIIIRTTDSDQGFELDTAQIFVKENAFCKFIDYAYTGTVSGTRIRPQNVLDDPEIKPGYGYFIRRGSIIYDGFTSFTGHIASKDHPTIIASYGKGNKPKFTNGKNICFYIGDATGGLKDPVNSRSEYIYFFDLYIRDYASSAFYCRRKSDNIAWFNIDIRNCDKNDMESSLAINTAFPDMGSIGDSSAVYNFEFLNCTFDTTSLHCSGGCEKSFIKVGVGRIYIINCNFGSIEGLCQPLRLAAGHGSVVRHCLFEPGLYSCTIEHAANIQCRQDRVLIEDCMFNNLGNGVYITNQGTAGPEVQPDGIIIRNCHFKGHGLNAIQVRPVTETDNPGYHHIFEDNYIENVGNGIDLSDCVYPTIRRNRFDRGNGTAILVTGNEPSIGITISYNIIHGFSNSGILIDNGSQIDIYNNTVIGPINCLGATEEKVYNNYASLFISLETSSNNIDIDTVLLDKHFVDFENHNYQLRSTAKSSIDRGRNVGIKSDYSGNTIIGLPEIGANEYVYPDRAPEDNTDSPALLLNIYPNPSSDIVNVEVLFKRSETGQDNLTEINRSTISVVDILGNVLITKTLDNTLNYVQEDFNLSHLTNGVYFIIFILGGKQISEKFVLRH